MSEGGRQDPRLGEREVSLILRRALELEHEEQRQAQAQAPQALVRQGGASLADVEAIASEVGIEPALVRRAAAELEARPRPVETSRWTGGPSRILFERVLPGEPTAATIETLLGVIQQTLGQDGQPSLIGRVFTWTSARSSRRPGARRLTISVVPRDGSTTVRIEEKLDSGGLFGGLVGGVGGGSSGISLGVGLGALHSPVAAAALWLFVAGSAYVSARLLHRRLVRKRTEDLTVLFARVCEHLRA